MKQMKKPQTRDHAFPAAVLRGVVAGYLIFLGVKIITNKDTDMSSAMSAVLGGIMLLAGAAFGVYTLLSLRADLLTAEQNADTPEEESK